MIASSPRGLMIGTMRQRRGEWIIWMICATMAALNPSASVAQQRYRAVDLNGSEPNGTVVLALSADQAVGFAIDRYSAGGETRYCRYAVHWDNGKATPTRLDVPGSSCADVRGISGARQVGAMGSDYTHAVIWEDATQKARELSRSGIGYSMANGIDGEEVVGQASGIATSGYLHAVLWQTGSNSMVDLNGPDHLESAALAIHGQQEVGWASGPFGENAHAMLWSGSYRTGIDLNPEQFGSSYAYALDAGSEVGVGIRNDSAHALLWHGAAAAAVDLNPAGFVESYATGVRGNRQVGYAIKPDLGAHAMIWSGHASGYIDLQKFLPPSLSQSYATSIDSRGDIGGYATATDGTPHAIVWQPVRMAPLPAGKIASNGR